MNHGTFSGDPRTRWKTEPNKPDRIMVLLDGFTFTDPKGKLWSAPEGAEIDGASIPRALWTVVGSPYTGDYRRASIVHDIAGGAAQGDAAHRKADKMFYHACRAGGCSVREAIILYLGVRIGSILNKVAIWSDPSVSDGEASFTSRPRLIRTSQERRLEQDFAVIADQVLAGGEIDDIDEIERRSDKALSSAVGVDIRTL